MTHPTPTAEEFLDARRWPPTPEDDVEDELPELDLHPRDFHQIPPRPLESIANSLRQLVTVVNKVQAEHEADAEADASKLRLEQDLADLEDKHQSLFGLVADIEKIVLKSTSQVSLAVKDAIKAWRNPQVEDDGEPRGGGPDPEQHDPDTDEPRAGARPQQPAQDADVEEWRAYCRALRPAEFLPTSLDTMNRSQIRTFLGIEHGGEES